MVERRGPLAGASTAYVDVRPALARIDDFAAFMAPEPEAATRWSDLLKSDLLGRPIGAKAWIEPLENEHGKMLSPGKRGPKPRLAPSQDESAALFGD
jgi:putative transposase